jgi:hypothetical protein
MAVEGEQRGKTERQSRPPPGMARSVRPEGFELSGPFLSVEEEGDPEDRHGKDTTSKSVSKRRFAGRAR